MSAFSVTYLEQELTSTISKLELKTGDNIYITGNLGPLGHIRLKKNEKLESLLKAFNNNIGNQSTIFSPSASMNLCNTEKPYDKYLTPSNQMGSFAEYFRKLPESIRSSHPFWSISGIGPEALRLNKLSRHAYGAGSAWSHFLDMDVTQVNFGIHPSKAVTLIHHVETVVGVPYRYTKEFSHPIVVGERIESQLFYQSVFYADTDAKKRCLLNEHYFSQLKSMEKLVHEIHEPSGLSFWSFKMRDFYNVALDFFVGDIYNYLEGQPLVRPYTK